MLKFYPILLFYLRFPEEPWSIGISTPWYMISKIHANKSHCALILFYCIFSYLFFIEESEKILGIGKDLTYESSVTLHIWQILQLLVWPNMLKCLKFLADNN